jgi:hypothetical protein
MKIVNFVKSKRKEGITMLTLESGKYVDTIPKKACFPASNAGKKLIEEYQEFN